MADSFIPKIALDYIKNKNLKTGFSYKDVWNEEHATGFTVAKAMQIDVLSDMKSAVEKAIEKGETFEQFKKNIKPTLIQKGWWGKKDMVDPLTGETVNAQLGSDRRLKTIYDTNIWSAYSKGSYDRAMESVFVKYFMYRIGYAQRHREQHVAWDGLVLPKDDAFWDTHYPPNGYGCHCYVTTLTEERKQRYEKEGFPTPRMQDGSGGVNKPIKTAAPKEEFTAYENLRKGTVERIPKGITPGFAWNQGDPRSSQTMRMCMDKVRQKFPDKADELARYFANENVTKGIVEQPIKLFPERVGKKETGKCANFIRINYKGKVPDLDTLVKDSGSVYTTVEELRLSKNLKPIADAITYLNNNYPEASFSKIVWADSTIMNRDTIALFYGHYPDAIFLNKDTDVFRDMAIKIKVGHSQKRFSTDSKFHHVLHEAGHKWVYMNLTSKYKFVELEWLSDDDAKFFAENVSENAGRSPTEAIAELFVKEVVDGDISAEIKERIKPYTKGLIKWLI